MASGVFRGWVESRRPEVPKAVSVAVATMSCSAWAVAPLLAWFSGRLHGSTVAAVLLCSGFFLVFTQMRAAIKEALIVSSPYTMASLVILAMSWRESGFWTVAATVPVLTIALLIKVLVTQLKDSELEDVAHEQAQLIQALEEARDRANAASEAKSNFLAVVSHELRTPMNGVLGAAQLLSSSGLADREQGYVDIIRGSGEGLLDLLNDLLDVSKMEAGKLELHPQAVDVGGLQNRIVGPCRAQAETKGLVLNVINRGGAPDHILADPLRIGQVVQNLLSNAIKFTDVGSVTLTISAEPAGEGRLRMTFEVEDTGPGITEADQASLFQPFQQLDSTSTRRFGGTGLGLTIARRIAREMGGDVKLRSHLGRGSVFTFTAIVDPVIPIASGAPEATDEPATTGGLRILVVEDHPVNRTILKAWLEAQGHSCALAEHGEEALAAASRQPFDAVLMDVNMPVMDGLTATRRLRATPGINRNTTVAILSASARPEDHALGLAAGADVYLNKPLDFSQIATLLAGLSRPGAHSRGETDPDPILSNG